MTTEYSIQKMVSDGTLSTIALGIQYLQRNDIYMRIAGEETPQSGAPSGYTWSFINNTTLKILPVVPNGVEVVVYRRTDIDAMYNIYSQNAQFDEATIDENNQQLLYIAQEYLEQGIPGAGVDTLEFMRDDGTYTYYRIKRTDGSYSDEFAVPSAGSVTKIFAREALRRSYAEAGYNLVEGSFEAGGTLVNANDVLLQEHTGEAYLWKGSYPKTVPTNSTPATTGGVSDSGWVPLGGITLRSELAARLGATLIGTEYGKTVASASNINLTHDELSITTGVAGYKAFVSGLGSFTWVAGSTATPDGVNVIQVTGVVTGRWVRDNIALSFADLRTKQPSQSRAVTLYEHRAGFKYGGGNFVWDAASTATDNGGTIAAVTGIATGRWVRVGYQHLEAAMFGLPKAGDCLAELQAIEAIQYATGIDCYFNIDGTYETIGEVNWPWRQETVPAATFKDYKGARLVCKGPGVVFKTTSATGADILQLNSVSNFSVIGWPTLTAVLTATANAGSNGISVTNGGKNIYCEVEAKDLPFTVKPAYLDGGKAITIQNGASTLLPYQNVKLICRRAENCAYGATADVATQPLVSKLNWYGNLLDVTAIDCYRAAQVSADSPTEGTVPSNGLNMGLDIVVDALNCQQDYVEARGWCVNAKVRTQRNKGTAGLIGKNPNDSKVFVDQIVASYGGSFEIDGGVTSVDYLHGVGGLITTNGNSQTKGKAFRYSVRYQGALASGDQVRLIDAGGNTVTGCTFNIFGTVGFSSAPLIAAGNSVFVNGYATLRGLISA